MIIYKNGDGNWRIPTSIVKNVGGSWQYADSMRRNTGSGWEINWHKNQSSFSTTGNLHPFWQYSMNPNFNVSENNTNGLNGMYELSFDTGIGAPDQNCRYSAGSGELNISLTAKDSNNFCDGILKSKWPLNVPSGSTYRSRVVITSRTPANKTFGVMPCRYYRVLIDKLRDNNAANSVQLSEFRLFDTNGNSLSATYSNGRKDGTTPQPSDSPSNEGPTNAGDGSLGTKWLNFQKTNAILNITFASNTTIAGYRFATANDATERDLVSWRLQASTNNSTWVTIATVVDWSTTTTRQAWEDDFFFEATILTGFWSAPTYNGADFKGEGVATHWSPKVDAQRTTSFSQSGTGWSFNYTGSTKTIIYDVTFPSANLWARPLIKLESRITDTLPITYKIDEWDITRIS